MKNLFKYMSFINIILYLVLPTNIFAEYTPFSNAKNARELIKIAEKLNLRVNLRSVPAKTLEQYDSVSQIHVSGRYVYAYWHNSFRLPSYLGKSINEVKREFANSNIILKILYTPTYSDNYNRVAKQSIYPRQIIYASKLVKTTNSTKEKDQTPKYTGFTKPKLIQGGSNTQNTSNKQFNQKTNRYDEEGNTILSLYVYKYAGKPKKMIDLSNLTLEEAKRKIKEANFPIGYIQDSYEKTSNPKLFGKIFEQTIKAGTLVDKPQYMGVKIYGFPATKMPDLTKGWTVTKASKTSYLSLITLYTKTYDKTLDGIIFEQSVKPGTLLIKKTLLTIKAYKYENPYYRADFIHLNQDKAIEIAKQRNLEYEIVTKDIFEYFKSTTLGNDFYQKQHDTIVDVTQNGKKLVLTVVKFVQKEGIMPNFIEQACSDIVKPMYKLKQKIPGLTYKTEYIAETVFEKSDKVASTKPIAGEKIKSLDNIIIYCRRFTGNHNDSIATIPNLTKKTKDEAIKILNNLGFKKIEIKKLNEVNFVQGTVVMVTGNMPFDATGYKLFKNETIHLYIADANAVVMYLMPNVIGLTMKEAKETLIYRGYKNIKFLDETTQYVKYTTTLPAGTVVKTYPSYKAITTHDSTKELIVRLKKGEKLLDDVSLPSTEGKTSSVLIPAIKTTLDDTIKEMKEKGLIPLIKKIVSKNPSLKGTVDLNTIPPYNTIVPKNTQVTITTYVNSISMPNVSNYIMSNFMTGTSYRQYYTKEYAISELEKQGFNVQVSYKQTDNINLHDKVSSQNPKAGSNVEIGTTVKLVIFGPVPIQTSIRSNKKLSQVPFNIKEQIESFYKTFEKAYESKDEYQVVNLLIDDWQSSDGGDISDLEDTLNNIFSVFDEVQYNISDLNIENSTQDKYIVSYNLTIKAQIYENDIEHIEKSSVKEEVYIKNGKVKIIKTINGKFWSIQ